MKLTSLVQQVGEDGNMVLLFMWIFNIALSLFGEDIDIFGLHRP